MKTFAVTADARWVALPSHQRWLDQQVEALFAFYERNLVNPLGGFYDLDDLGRPTPPGWGAGAPPARYLFATTRIVHAFSIAHLMGRPGADAIVDHGMDFLWNGHRDAERGGYFWGVGYEGPTDSIKQAYGHAFVLLAASSAKVAGHPDAERLLTDISTVISDRFWEERFGAVAEEFTRDWRSFDDYRGQNSNMHLTEALMAAFEATNDSTYLRMAERVADRIVRINAGENDWRLPEHFKSDWTIDRDYSGSPMFRPYGTTPGHSLEWSRLLLQLWELGGRKLDWLPGASRSLFQRATEDGWDPAGGFYYTLEWDGRPRIRDRYWWPCCEAIGAASFLNAIFAEPLYEDWYRRVWSFVATRFIDRENGGWRAQLDESLRPNANPFFGKNDIYHSLQACLIPTLPTTGSVTGGLAQRFRGTPPPAA
ncbi:mannose/cellobiose epimerase-like protein (N-acyl-D-glucosamine 2-epimerase family) [Roseiarcus fermentans]|uniref:Mannose/cellobiose epimerase-like protein (N-acyl-D-glucosamine 2-epimerase family) n=1 Tax=Roseiarcus fermentans TaxID=1473586 RepID=A0A366FMH2_9HYPH|nr:AGE family epimerase/isomerase [Roseiarcus fermentans]RBP15842.1 mannose/cellobiose epimerase-like protein (N-acyl-D-glucosamine 2-epimerase family) [Roseiarcus fermentans]